MMLKSESPSSISNSKYDWKLISEVIFLQSSCGSISTNSFCASGLLWSIFLYLFNSIEYANRRPTSSSSKDLGTVISFPASSSSASTATTTKTTTTTTTTTRTSEHQQTTAATFVTIIIIVPSVLVSIVLVGCFIFVVTLVNSSENENAKLQDCIL